jgi:beta-glucosidase
MKLVSRMNKSPFVVLLLLLSGLSFQQQPPIYHTHWIDLNKNGKKDVYEDATAPIAQRVKDLLTKMNTDEKTMQMVTLYGWKRVLKDSLPTPEWKSKIWKDGIANIDEHLNGFINFKKTNEDLLVTDIEKHVWAMNEVQRFFIEQTRLGIPADFSNEGLRGIEWSHSTSFPAQLNMGMTWNRQLVYELGRITGQEARALGYTNVYAPILDVARDQRWGRLEEVYSESPYMVAELGIQMVKGMQYDHQVAATAKHFAVYSANKGAREGQARTDPQISPREVEDELIYPFRRVIREAGVLGMMSSYNDYDGIPVSGSNYWLIQKLRNELGFKGYVVSDSDALEYLTTKHRTAANLKEAVFQAFTAGMNVRCTFTPPDSIVIYLRQLIKEGRIPMDTINKRVADVLTVKFTTGLFDHPYIESAEQTKQLVNSVAHQQQAEKASYESIVLLKNNNHVLPLTGSYKQIAVIGPNATNDNYAHTHYGPLHTSSISVLAGIREKWKNKATVQYAKGCELTDARWPESEVLPEPPNAAEQKQIDSAVELAKASDIAIVVLGGNTATAGENKSRTTLELPGHQNALIKAIKATGKPVVVVLIGSQPMGINWIDRNIDGIVYAGYPGAFGGKAVADVLFGDYNPGGKLTLTWPRSVGQLPLTFLTKPNAQTDEGESARVTGILYAFGHGSSYTTFEYSGLQITPQKQTIGKNSTVAVTVSNKGAIAGDEVVQLYLRDDVSSVTIYEKKLIGFERVHLNAGETKTIQFTILPEEMKLWDRHWKHVIEPGLFKVMVGSASDDIRLNGEFWMH